MEFDLTESAVRFSCGEHQLFGVLHRAASPDGEGASARSAGVIFLNAGARYRSGPCRLYVRQARELARAGFHVLRFDLPGTGDSEGTVDSSLGEQRKFLEHGKATQSAIAFFKQETGVEQIGLLGLCGGAFSALCAAAVDPRVAFLVLLSFPVEQLEDLSEEIVNRVVLRQYIRKMTAWRYWWSLFTLRTDFRMMWRALSQVGKLHRPHSLIDESLWAAFETSIGLEKPILFVFAEEDPLYRSFEIGYGPRIAKLSAELRSRFEVFVVEKANHTFSSQAWQKQIFSKVDSWLASVC